MRHAILSPAGSVAIWALAGVLLLIPCASFAQETARVFKAGASAIDITPQKLPIDSAGSMGPRFCDSVHDRLQVRCLVLDNGETKIALAVCDSCMIPRAIFDAAKGLVAKNTGIPTDHILCSATHCHSAVTVTPTFQSQVEGAYCEFLIQRIAEGIIKAHAQREPARIGWAVGNNPRQVHNRRWYLRPGSRLDDPFDLHTDRVRMNPSPNSTSLVVPAGPMDPEVPVLAVQALDGRPIALWANYALHYVGGCSGWIIECRLFWRVCLAVCSAHCCRQYHARLCCGHDEWDEWRHQQHQFL